MTAGNVPTQRTIVTVAASAVGVLLLVIGLVALARTGIPAEALTESTASVGPFTRTPLMAIIEIVVGLIVLVGGVTAEKGTLMGMGLISIVFGLVWLIEPGAFNALLGVGRGSAVLYLIVGIVLLVSGGLIGPRVLVRESERA